MDRSGRVPRRIPPDDAPTAAVTTWRPRGGALAATGDRVAREEPLEIRITAGGERKTVAITMRTPGADRELAAGFLYGEGLVRDRGLITGFETFTEEDPETGARRDVVEIGLKARRLPNLQSLERHFFTGSACGVCGRAALDEMLVAGCEVVTADGPGLTAEELAALPDTLRSAQSAVDATGGVHAAARFDASGTLVAAREDVGRHNALDKLIGRSLLPGELEDGAGVAGGALGRSAVLVSGRASFEIVQKCLTAGVPVICAVSAPTSLAVEMAERFGITLIGFVRSGRFNVYSHPHRVVLSS
jgi:FdhD protein